MPDIMHHEPTPDHADQAASHVLALVAAGDPTYRVTAEKHDTMVELVRAVVRAVSSERVR